MTEELLASSDQSLQTSTTVTAWRTRPSGATPTVKVMAARFSMHRAMPLEPGLETHVSLIDHAGDHQEWRGADETDALMAVWTAMHSKPTPESLSDAASAIKQRTDSPVPPSPRGMAVFYLERPTLANSSPA